VFGLDEFGKLTGDFMQPPFLAYSKSQTGYED
jgi:hypothetical protein